MDHVSVDVFVMVLARFVIERILTECVDISLSMYLVLWMLIFYISVCTSVIRLDDSKSGTMSFFNQLVDFDSSCTAAQFLLGIVKECHTTL